ncbi:MAG: prolyl oligopeptidase family serine peptidase [Planctomyces sp.]|nr:prolyl oligopeptidase family serine peptidase [Planctomyces sp.]
MATMFGVAMLPLLMRQMLRPIPDEQMEVRVAIGEGSVSVRVDVFLPETELVGDEKSPAVLLLHGIEGASLCRSHHYQTAQSLADRGYAVFFVHYFDVANYEDLWLTRSDGSVDVTQIESFCRNDSSLWTSAVTSVVSAVRTRRDIDDSRIALNGNSLGGFVAIAAASQLCSHDQCDVSAVVVNWGAMFDTTVCRTGFPPTLFVHGELDEVIPIEWARRAETNIRAVQEDVQFIVIPDADHVARSPESDRETLEFLNRCLSSKKHGLQGAAIRQQPVQEVISQRMLRELGFSFFDYH